MADNSTMDDNDYSPSTALAVLRSSDRAALAELKDMMLNGGSFDDITDDPALISRQILEEIFSATSVDELERKPAESWRDYAGVPMQVNSFSARKSSFDSNDFYFIIRATNMTDGEDHVLTTGSQQVRGMLIQLADLGELPCVRILNEQTTEHEDPVTGKVEKRTVLFLVSTPQELEARRDARVSARLESGHS